VNEQQIARFPDYVVLPEDPRPARSGQFCRDCGARFALLRQHGYDQVTGDPLYAWRCPNYRWWRHLLLTRCWITDVVTADGVFVRCEGLW